MILSPHCLSGLVGCGGSIMSPLGFGKAGRGSGMSMNPLVHGRLGGGVGGKNVSLLGHGKLWNHLCLHSSSVLPPELQPNCFPTGVCLQLGV
jgi:hypothetical protein